MSRDSLWVATPHYMHFVAAGTKDYSQYENELEITSRVLRLLSDDAFRNIALGENFFRFTAIPYTAPQICKRLAQEPDKLHKHATERHSTRSSTYLRSLGAPMRSKTLVAAVK